VANLEEKEEIIHQKEKYMSSEEHDGFNAYWKGEPKSSNPHNWSNQTWWMVEDWDSGWEKAQEDDYDD
tara:strand:+ start:36635 stop:36838 length:204 start_codon:yes stop_codon:yes gene_type:complete